MEVGSRLKAVALEIASLRKDVEDLRKKIGAYEARLELTPIREQQLAELTRSCEDARTYYESLLQKKLQSGMATKLEKRQQGERFRILDPASLPKQPEGKTKIIVLGWLLGLFVGGGLTVSREMADPTVHDEDDTARWSSLPVLGSIPVFRSKREQRRKRWFLRLESTAAVLLGLMSIAAAVHSYLG
jgi:capsular polysaccharide biosynthesis protein